MKLDFNGQDPYLAYRSKIEQAIRADFSEYAIMKIHDAVYATVKRATNQIYSPFEAIISDSLGLDPVSFPRHRHRQALARLRSLLGAGCRERALQDALIDSGLLNLSCRALQEVTLKPTRDHPGMRMDLVLCSDSIGVSSTEVVELKRGTHLLVARAGQPTERLSSKLRRAIAQLKEYGHRIVRDVETTGEVDQRFGIRFGRPNLRLIAGRRLSNAPSYYLLGQAEAIASTSLNLRIYTWDAFLAETERVVD
jgi:hypothetical protein